MAVPVLPTSEIARLQALVNGDFTADTIVSRFSSIANDVSALITYLLEVYTQAQDSQDGIAALLTQATAEAALISEDATLADNARIEAQSQAATASSLAAELNPVVTDFLYADRSDRWQRT